MIDVAVIDYGMGNLRSVEKAIEHVSGNATVRVTDDPAMVANARRVVFPGQGAMPDCMAELEARGLREAVLKAAAEKPFLGICIGLQMLFERSEEGHVAGLGVFPGQVRRFPDEKMIDADGVRLKVPHMGWNEVWHHRDHAMWQNIPDGDRFYYVHSYYVDPAQDDLAAAHTDYGIRFTSAVARDNIFAVQFHPEKSARAGLQLLTNFIAWNP